MDQFSIAEARNRFTQIVHMVEHGKPWLLFSQSTNMRNSSIQATSGLHWPDSANKSSRANAKRLSQMCSRMCATNRQDVMHHCKCANSLQ
jgi:hypothetical protein